MARKELTENAFDEFISERERKIRLEKSGGRPGVQRRLKNAVLRGWWELLAMDQIGVPREVEKIAKNKLTQAATIVFWMSPDPRIELKSEDPKKNTVKLFIDNGQSEKWKRNEKASVISYFKEIVDNKFVLKNYPPQVPTEIREITEGRITESALAALWVIPSPWLWGMDKRDYDLDSRRSPYGMWKDDNNRELVTDYMRVMADNLEAPLVKQH